MTSLADGEVKHVIMRRQSFPVDLPHRLGVSNGKGGISLWLPTLPRHLIWRNVSHVAAPAPWNVGLQ